MMATVLVNRIGQNEIKEEAGKKKTETTYAGLTGVVSGISLTVSAI